MSVKSDRVVAQIQDDGPGPIKVILPTERKAQRLSYRQQLPSLLRQTLGVEGTPDDHNLLATLLLEPASTLRDILDEWDVSPLSWIPAPPIEAQPARRASATPEPTSFRLAFHSPGASALDLPFRQSQTQRNSRRPSYSPSPDPFRRNTSEYLRLLRNVQRVAQGLPRVEQTFAPFDPSAAFGSMQDSFDYRAKIGAAGELLVSQVALCTKKTTSS